MRVICAGCVLLGDVQLNRGPECDHRFGLSVAVRRELKFGAKSACRGCRESQVAAIESACWSTRGQAESSTWFGRVRSAGEPLSWPFPCVTPESLASSSTTMRTVCPQRKTRRWEEPHDSDGRLRSGMATRKEDGG